jgi:large subunit ribosomal protein L22
MEVRAHIKYVRISPIKLRVLIDSVRVLSPRVALDHLGLSQKRSAKVLYKAIKSAVANGEVLPGFDAQKARFKTLSIDEGPFLKRFRAGSRGMARPYVRKSSHIMVVIEQQGIDKTAPKQAANKAKTTQQSEEAVKQAKAVNKPLIEKAAKTARAALPRQQAQKSVTNTQRTTNK